MSDWRPIDEKPDVPEDQRTVKVIVTDGEYWTPGIWAIDYESRTAKLSIIRTHVVDPADATHYLIPELPETE